jgi:oxygen-independent coproporphyrinogen-3 oxidase
LDALTAAREDGFKSISIDLIYGLPFQTVASFQSTIEKILAAEPDRLSVFNYAHLPEMFKPQRRINAEDLPSASVKLEILRNTIEQLTQGGYVYIGMDHFAKPDDELAEAQRNRSLYRNFQGYSTHADCDLIAMGITSISKVGNTYSQNLKTLDEYYNQIDAGHIPVYRGIELNDDDLLRREIITQLICHYCLDIPAIESRFEINFIDYFRAEMTALKEMQADKLVEITAETIRVLPAGWLLIRNVCMVFDRYLQSASGQRYSKVI